MIEVTNEIKLKRLKKINNFLTIIQIIIIVLIVGIYIFNYINENCNNNDKEILDTQEGIAAFNSKFMPYIGKNKTLPVIRAFIDKVIGNNAINISNQVKVNNKDPKTIMNTGKELKDDSYTIGIDSSCFNNEGYIININITDSKGKPIF